MTEVPRPVRTDSLTYEYTRVRTDREMESLYRDSYAAFGWLVDDYGASRSGPNTVTIKFKRPRRIKNRPQVVELQRRAERALLAIAALEKSKDTTAFVVAMVIGLVGTGLLAGSVFAVQSSNWGLSIPLGVLGLAGWLAGYLAHGWVRTRRTARVAPQIDRQYDIVYESCEQAAHLSA